MGPGPVAKQEKLLKHYKENVGTLENDLIDTWLNLESGQAGAMESLHELLTVYDNMSKDPPKWFQQKVPALFHPESGNWQLYNPPAGEKAPLTSTGDAALDAEIDALAKGLEPVSGSPQLDLSVHYEAMPETLSLETPPDPTAFKYFMQLPFKQLENELASMQKLILSKQLETIDWNLLKALLFAFEEKQNAAP